MMARPGHTAPGLRRESGGGGGGPPGSSWGGVVTLCTRTPARLAAERRASPLALSGLTRPRYSSWVQSAKWLRPTLHRPRGAGGGSGQSGGCEQQQQQAHPARAGPVGKPLQAEGWATTTLVRAAGAPAAEGWGGLGTIWTWAMGQSATQGWSRWGPAAQPSGQGARARACACHCVSRAGWPAGWLAAPPPPVPAGQAGCSLPPVPARLAVPLLHKLAGLAGCSPPPVPAGLAVPLLHKLAALLEGGGAGGVVLRAAVAPPVAVAEGVVGCAADKDATCSGKEHGGSG